MMKMDKILKHLKDKKKFQDFIDTLEKDEILVSSIKTEKPFISKGKTYTTFKLSLTDDELLEIKINSGHIEGIIYAKKVILDIEDTHFNIVSKAREIVKMSIVKQLKKNRKKAPRSEKNVKDIKSDRAELLAKRKALKKEIKALEATLGDK